jgi:hypothetical protein
MVGERAAHAASAASAGRGREWLTHLARVGSRARVELGARVEVRATIRARIRARAWIRVRVRLGLG